MASNVFGIPITDATLRVIPEYERRARKDRAHVALEMKKAENKDVIAREYVENLKRQWGTGVSTLCLVYNATGGTVTFVTHHDYWGHIGEAAPYPVEIANGQWGAFLHVKTTGTATGSTAAVVYRGKNEDGADCDWMFAWSNPWDRACWNNTMLNKFKVRELYIVCSIDIDEESLYTQVLKVWDVLPLEEFSKLVKRLDGIFGMYTDDYLNRCKVKCHDGDFKVPMTWTLSSGLIQYKNLSETENGKALINDASLIGKGYVEDAKVSESLLLMKFYLLSIGAVSHLLSGCNGKELSLPFELTNQEKEIIHFNRSTFILGRSGTGKTTVLTMKLFQNEQLYHLASEGYHQVQSNLSTDDSWRHQEDSSETNQIQEAKRDILHQIFVTVSPKLCFAVKQHVSQLKSFVCGNKSSAKSSSVRMDDDNADALQFADIPDSFVDILPESYPLIITFSKFLMMLDGTVGTSYFERFHDARQLAHGKSGNARSLAFQIFIRTKEVTFKRFSSSYWSHFNILLTKKLVPSIVFTEIMSVIKGGLIAGEVCDGKLSRQDYVSLSQCRVGSSISRQKREMMYDIFLAYEKKKAVNGEFDFADLVIDLHHRLRNESMQRAHLQMDDRQSKTALEEGKLEDAVSCRVKYFSDYQALAVVL